jgi:hypothetical protein
MRAEVLKLMDIIKLAHKRGSFTLEESAVIYQILQGINKCPAMQEPKEDKPKKDLEIVDEDEELP